ncbi:MAG: hypothetical protein QF637_11435 [Acidimicrobiales bacterium]|nr:hypothetical protein [Acidimicrobiales bacterium]
MTETGPQSDSGSFHEGDMTRRHNRVARTGGVPLVLALVVAGLGFIVGGCVWVVECAAGQTMSGMPSPDWCNPFD